MLNRLTEAMSQMLVAADLILGPTWEIVALGSPDQDVTREILESLWATFIPRRVVACRSADDSTYRSASRPIVRPQVASQRSANRLRLRRLRVPGTGRGHQRDRRHVD